MAYATPDHLVARHDADVIGDLATDDRQRLHRSQIPTAQNVLDALVDASGAIEVAMLQGARYAPSALQAIYDSTDAAYTNQKGHLIRITCTIAMAYLFERRPGVHSELAEKYHERAQESLNKLAKGQNLFGVPEADGGDTAGTAVPTIDGPTPQTVEAINLMTARAGRYFPGAPTRLPRSQGGGF